LTIKTKIHSRQALSLWSSSPRYPGCPVGDGLMRILPHAVHVPMVIDADETLSPMAPNSSLPTSWRY
jgi:hypothetical protein